MIFFINNELHKGFGGKTSVSSQFRPPNPELFQAALEKKKAEEPFIPQPGSFINAAAGNVAVILGYQNVKVIGAYMNKWHDKPRDNQADMEGFRSDLKGWIVTLSPHVIYMNTAKENKDIKPLSPSELELLETRIKSE